MATETQTQADTRTGKTTWQLDPAHTQVEFAVKHMMFTSVRGRFGEVSGKLELDPENPNASRVEVEIDAASIDTGVPDRDAHLRSADFLDAENHPKLTFRSTAVKGADFEPGEDFQVEGELEIRGTTRKITLDAIYHGQGKDPFGNHKAGFTAEMDLDRSDFGLTWNQALEAGGVLVGERVKITIDAQFAREES